jgi:hypothetical protein
MVGGMVLPTYGSLLHLHVSSIYWRAKKLKNSAASRRKGDDKSKRFTLALALALALRTNSRKRNFFFDPG